MLSVKFFVEKLTVSDIHRLLERLNIFTTYTTWGALMCGGLGASPKDLP